MTDDARDTGGTAPAVGRAAGREAAEFVARTADGGHRAARYLERQGVDGLLTVRRTQGNPLAAGVIAFGAGLLTASPLPGSEPEQRAVGKAVGAEAFEPAKDAARDSAQRLKDEAAGTARAAADEVKETASDAARTTRDQARERADDVGERAREAGGSVAGEARG